MKKAHILILVTIFVLSLMVGVTLYDEKEKYTVPAYRTAEESAHLETLEKECLSKRNGVFTVEEGVITCFWDKYKPLEEYLKALGK